MGITKDKIILNQLVLFPKIGCSKEERSFPQRVVVVIEIEVENLRAGKTAALSDTICYFSLKNDLKSFVEARSWTLAEELAEESIAFIFSKHQQAVQVTFEVRKSTVPDTAWVAVSLTRSR